MIISVTFFLSYGFRCIAYRSTTLTFQQFYGWHITWDLFEHDAAAPRVYIQPTLFVAY